MKFLSFILTLALASVPSMIGLLIKDDLGYFSGRAWRVFQQFVEVCIIELQLRWHDKNLLMNRAAMRITASLLLWYLLSTMNGREPGTAHSSPTHPFFGRVLSSWGHHLFFKLWNIIAWLVSTQVLFQQGLVVLLFHSEKPWLVCYLPVAYNTLYFPSMCINFTGVPAPNTSIQCAPFAVIILIVLCKTATKLWSDEETLNHLLEALCTLHSVWSHC